MTVIAKLNHYRMAPRKMRLVADLIRGKRALEAKQILHFLLKRGALIFEKLLDSAIANAKNNFHLEENNLYIAKVLVNEGPKLKRWRARARGRAGRIQKKTSHLLIALEETAALEEKGPGAVKGERAVKKEEAKIAAEPLKKEKIKKEKSPKAKIASGIIMPKSAPLAQKIFRRKSI